MATIIPGSKMIQPESLKWHEFNDEVVTEIRSEEIQQMCENQEGV